MGTTLYCQRVVFSVAKNLDPTRHFNSDVRRAHILTFEVIKFNLKLTMFIYVLSKQLLYLGFCKENILIML